MSRRYAKDVYALSGGTPTTTAIATLVTALRAGDASTFGIKIDEGRGVAAAVSVNSGHVIVSGALRAYAYMPTDRNNDGSIPAGAFRWVKYPALDYDLVTDSLITGSTERDIPTGDKLVLSSVARLAWVPDAVVGDSGSTSINITYCSNIRAD